MPAIQASGLASGLDTASIINGLVAAESQPITDLRNRQSAFKSQVSQLGQIASKIAALQSAAQALKSGAVQFGVQSSNVAFSATPGTDASAGDYSIQVTQLATAAKYRSQAAADSDTFSGGTLHLSVRGTNTDVSIADGATLSDMALAINQSGAAVTASVISDGTNSYLSVVNRDTGVPSGVDPANALTFSFDASGAGGNTLTMSQVTAAQNAALTVDNLPVSSASNTVAGIIPGVTLNLKSKSTSAEQLTIGTDADATTSKLQAFVDAYNGVASLLQQQLDVSATSDRTGTLAGDPTVRSLQQQLQSLVASAVGASGSSVRSLPDLGITTAQDGTLSLDSSKLQAALAQDPGAVNAIFTQPTTGLVAATKTLSDLYTDPVSGAPVIRQQGPNNQVTQMDDQASQMQARIDSFRATLLQQFTAMETIVSALKSSSNYLTQVSNASSSSSG
ncbi:MAG: flagellar filament capping protein FliD [Deltaproteobacteria bacterium]|nr:flagellar filament capping protein FliD [Deltaproteobacteria bacterium]